MENRIRYVYKIFDELNKNKIYIGSSFDVDKRWYQHKKNSNSRKLKADMLEFGTQDFGIEIIFEGTEDEAYAEEIRLIAELKPYYNNKGDKGGKWGGEVMGEKNPNSKLKKQDIITICIRAVTNNEEIISVAKDFPHITISHIYKIIYGNAWEHIKEAPRRKTKEISILNDEDIADICTRVVIHNEDIISVSKDYPQVTSSYIYEIINGNARQQVKDAPRKSPKIRAELEDQDIVDICIRIIKNNEKVIDVSKDYPQIGIHLIYDIINGNAWTHVKNAPRKKAQKIFTEEEVVLIRNEAKSGKTPKEIKKKYFPNKLPITIKNVIIGKSFTKYTGPIKGEDY